MWGPPTYIKKVKTSKNDILQMNSFHADNGSEFEGNFLSFLKENHIYLTETYVVDIIWGQSFAPDLLESIMKLSRLGKEQ